MSVLLRFAALVLVLSFGVSCISLSYPEPEAEPGAEATYEPASPRAAALRAERAAAGELSWSDLTRAAREYARLGEFGEAQERLAQAEILVQDLPPTSARRRTVFNTQARLAEQLAEAGEIDRADALASQLFEQAEREPELGDDALVSLALSVAERRDAAAAAADGSGPSTSPLPLYRIAFDTARRQTVNRERIEIGRRVAAVALREGDLPLARTAIDQSIADARRLIATPREQVAELEVLRARVALRQDDLEAAEDAALAADQIMDAIAADASQRAVTESLLADIASRRDGGGPQSPDDPATPRPAPREPTAPPMPVSTSEPGAAPESDARWGAESE